MSKIRCVILDDELPGLAYIRTLCEQFEFVEVERCFNSPEVFLNESKNIHFDVCLLDINMPGINGLEVARELKGKYVIFVSAFPEFAVDAFDLEAIDFIKKPLVKDRLEKALRKAFKLIYKKKEDPGFFTWNSNLGKAILFFDEILFISTSDIDKRDKNVQLSDDRNIVLKNITLEKLLSFLPSEHFIQINKAEIVSKKHIQAASATEIVIKTQPLSGNTTRLSIGESFRKPFSEWFDRLCVI